MTKTITIIEFPSDDRDVLLKTDEGFIQGNYSHGNKEWEFTTFNFHGCGCCGDGYPTVESWSELPK